MYAFLNFKAGTTRTTMMTDVAKVIAGETSMSNLSTSVDTGTSTISGTPSTAWTISGTIGATLASDSSARTVDFVHRVVGRTNQSVGLRLKWAATGTSFNAFDPFWYSITNDAPGIFAYPQNASKFSGPSPNSPNNRTPRIYGDAINNPSTTTSFIIVNNASGLWIAAKGSGDSNFMGTGLTYLKYTSDGHISDNESLPVAVMTSNTPWVSTVKVKYQLDGTYRQADGSNSDTLMPQAVTIGGQVDHALLQGGMLTCDASNNPRMPTWPIYLNATTTSTTATVVGAFADVTGQTGVCWINRFGGNFTSGQTITINGTLYVAIWNATSYVNLLVPLT